ncbi:MAG TPA: FTR1 family protein [Ktedonobacterales bacterium]|nr:FTR1 family protein [Ktedonobacterales bacterium]
MVTTFILFLREGFEAALVIGMLLAALRQMGQTSQMRAVWGGAALAILASLAAGIAVYATIHEYEDTAFAATFEAITFLSAVVLLTTVTFWMQRHSRTLKREIAAKASAAGSGLALGLLAFTTVGREAVETAVFTLATAFQGDAVLVVLGAVLGLLAAIGLCVLIYRLGYRLDFRVFFRVMGVLLIFFAAGLFGSAVHEMQELNWLPLGDMHLWDMRATFSDEGVIGGLLHGLLGYSDHPTVLQSIAYVAYLVTAGGFFLHETRKPMPVAASSSSAATTTATGTAS